MLYANFIFLLCATGCLACIDKKPQNGCKLKRCKQIIPSIKLQDANYVQTLINSPTVTPVKSLNYNDEIIKGPESSVPQSQNIYDKPEHLIQYQPDFGSIPNFPKHNPAQYPTDNVLQNRPDVSSMQYPQNHDSMYHLKQPNDSSLQYMPEALGGQIQYQSTPDSSPLDYGVLNPPQQGFQSPPDNKVKSPPKEKLIYPPQFSGNWEQQGYPEQINPKLERTTTIFPPDFRYLDRNMKYPPQVYRPLKQSTILPPDFRKVEPREMGYPRKVFRESQNPVTIIVPREYGWDMERDLQYPEQADPWP